MGSENDLETLRPAVATLGELHVELEVIVGSAHRTPERVAEIASKARADGFGAIIAAAGLAHHLAGAVAARTTLPVIAVPVAAGPMNGVDALVSAVQMPPGVPVAVVGIGAAKNAAILAAEILAVSDRALAGRIEDLRAEQARAVEAANRRVQAALGSR
jgi:5-(carboxyamino)imidazole ribonucleotide mutase